MFFEFEDMASWAIYSLLHPSCVILLWIAILTLFQVVALFYMYLCGILYLKNALLLILHYKVWNKEHHCLFWRLDNVSSHLVFLLSLQYMYRAVNIPYVLNHKGKGLGGFLSNGLLQLFNKSILTFPVIKSNGRSTSNIPAYLTPSR